MKLLFKQRFFSWLDSYDIYDEYENTVYLVKGSWPGDIVSRYLMPMTANWNGEGARAYIPSKVRGV